MIRFCGALICFVQFILSYNVAEEGHEGFKMCGQRPHVRDSPEVGHPIGWLNTQLHGHTTW